MRYLRFSMMDAADVAKVAQANDKVMANLPQGYKVLSINACMGIAFPGQPANTIVSVSIVETEGAEALAATSYPTMLAGATIWNVPVMDVPVSGVAETEKRLRG
jgi:hypothetical protein